MLYRVLQSRPITLRTGKVDREMENGRMVEIHWERVVTWLEQGTAHSMDDAKRKFGGSPVLEPIDSIH